MTARTDLMKTPFSLIKCHSGVIDGLTKRRHAWLYKSSGEFGMPCFSKYAGDAHNTENIVPIRRDTNLESVSDSVKYKLTSIPYLKDLVCSAKFDIQPSNLDNFGRI